MFAAGGRGGQDLENQKKKLFSLINQDQKEKITNDKDEHQDVAKLKKEVEEST